MSTTVDEKGSPAKNEHGKRPAEATNDDTTAAIKRQNTRGLFRQPTVNELNRLQETENLFNSNLFRLQIEEILQEVKIKEKTEKKFKQWFDDFKIHLDAIPEDEAEYDLTEKTLAKKLKVKIPIPSALDKTKCIFKFHKFKDVQIVGSYALECSINSKLCIDIQVTVPAETYTKNDSVNYRYHKKRAAYLAFIASHLKNLESIEELNYTRVNGCDTKPIIEIKPAGKLCNHFSVRIHLVCEEDAYKLHRFNPTRNNLRESWLFSNKCSETTEIGSPTLYYNSTVLSDLTAETNQHLLNEVLGNSDNLKQAVVLLKIWLRQRKLAMSGHIVSSLVAYLVMNKRINNVMSSYQIVRNVWIALKTSEWDTKGISLHKETDSSAPSLKEFVQHFPVVFLDRTGHYNMTYNMNTGTYTALKRESSLAVEMLDNGKINSFIPLFMVPVKHNLQFDHIIRFKDLQSLKEAIISKSTKEMRLNYGVDQSALVIDSLHTLLVKGLANRVDLVLPLVEDDFSWSVKKSVEKAKEVGYKEKLSFGLILNSENSTNIIEKGPPANLPEAEEFRSFWGAKSELRRFQDGSITETIVWEADCLMERRAITAQIVDYLLELKYGIPTSSLFHVTNQLDSLLVRKKHVALPDAVPNIEETSVVVLRAFDELRRDLRGLTQLPLDISGVYGVSSVFSYCDPVPPRPSLRSHNPWKRDNTELIKDITKDGVVIVPEYTPVCKAVVELSHSGKWPGEIEAFRCLKAAFNLQIADRLNKQYSLPTQAYKTHIDVLKNGLVFRLQIAHPKEITLLRRQTSQGMVKYIETEESVNLQRDTVLLPRLRGALHGLHQSHPTFGPVSCLVKRWMSSHLLSPPHVPAMVCDLLTAAVYMRPEPMAAPAQTINGFLRVLKLIADTDWRSEMVLLDFSGDMTCEETSEHERVFSERDVTSAPAMYIVTSHDGPMTSPWAVTSHNVVARAKALANSTLAYMEQGINSCNDNLLQAFIPSYSGYDVLIHLHQHIVPYASERVDKHPEVTPSKREIADDVIPPVEFSAVETYVEELQSAFGDFALFFHDAYGGDVVAVLWRPDVAEPREFQLTNANALQPVKNKDGVAYRINTEALIEDFKIIGRGIVKHITVCS